MVVLEFRSKKPRVAASAYVSPRASVIGDVTIGEDTSVWESAVIRGDLEKIKIGQRCAVEDNVTIHAKSGRPVKIANNVIIGHNAVVHSAILEDLVLVGISSVVLDQTIIGRGAIIGAGAVVPQRMEIPERSLVLGVPGKIVKQLPENTLDETLARAETYYQLSRTYYELESR